MGAKVTDRSEQARIFRECATASDAGDRLGISYTAARQLRWRLKRSVDPATGEAFDVGEHAHGRTRRALVKVNPKS